MKTYCIGIDTGGTFTDGIVLHKDTKEVVYQAKTPTTHHDLSIGVIEVLKKLLQHNISTDEIMLLSVSTTLATNAIVEGYGARVALFVMGHVKHFKLPVVANIFFKGGHTITGEEDTPLDLEEIIDTLQGLKGKVDSYAVCGAMSIKNPTHEIVTEKAISLVDPKPVFTSHKVSNHPGILERSATACLHAKLQPIMTEFIASINKAMDALSLNCPVTIVCGDTSGISLDETVEKAALTMASGPAATAKFGSSLQTETALIVDIGGTTTDVCLVKDFKPVISESGCQIGQWRTHVNAVDMYTSAGGGDCHINCDNLGTISLDSKRVQPLSMTNNLPDPASWLNALNDSYLVMSNLEAEKNTTDDSIIAHLLEKGFAPPSEIASATGVQGIILEKRLEQLAYEQKVTLVGFTPTDAFHIDGSINIGEKSYADSGAAIIASQLGISKDEFCQKAIEAASKTIENIILTYLTNKQWPQENTARLLEQASNELFSTNFSLHLPIIGIGAAAKCFLPAIAKRLNTSIFFPENYEVGNAIGAALIALDGK